MPSNVQQTAYDKVQRLRECDDPRQLYKPLDGPLAGVYSIKCGRYRVLFIVKDEELANGDVLYTVLVRVVFAGIRRAGDRKDVYHLAQKLISYASKEIGKMEQDQEDEFDL